ncbi:MAG: DUF1848 domain-containing protein [Planctomycetes bacterium]|nr:DUF1848 domain-containing protein [Planctomycetota bacterium]
MIYSASRRTDLTTFYPDYLAGRLRRSRRLDGVVYWTKDLRNLVRHRDLAAEGSRFPAVIQFTVTGLAGTVWEPRVPPLAEQAAALGELARSLPRGAIRWRFDPIIGSPEEVRQRFLATKALLDDSLGGIDDVTVSFPDPYRRARERVQEAGLAWPTLTPPQQEEVIAAMVAAFAGPEPVKLCCEPRLNALPGVGSARCVDGSLFHRLYGLPLADLPPDGGQRRACGCSRSTDIGSYHQACGHRCLYCYATPE